MFIHSPRILSCLPTRSRLWLFPSFRPHSHTPSFVADLQVIACCCYQQLQVRWQTEAVDSDWSGARAERSPPLYRGSCLQLRDGKRILRWSIVLLAACVKSASEKMGWNGRFSQCVRAWVRVRSPASAITCVCVCQMELKYNNRLPGAGEVTHTDTRPGSSCISEMEITLQRSNI